MISNMVTYLTDQTKSILDTVLDRKSFRKNYDAIINNKIPAINKQIKQYVRDSFDAIKEEIYQELIQEINFDEERENIKKLFKDNTIPMTNHHVILFPKFSVKKYLNKLEDDKINDLYIYSSKEDIEKYSKKYLNLKKYTNEFVNDTMVFEENVIQYKNELKNKIKEEIPYLIDLYVKRLYDIFKKYESEDKFVINNKTTIKFEKKFDIYLKNAIREILKNN